MWQVFLFLVTVIPAETTRALEDDEFTVKSPEEMGEVPASIQGEGHSNNQPPSLEHVEENPKSNSFVPSDPSSNASQFKPTDIPSQATVRKTVSLSEFLAQLEVAERLKLIELEFRLTGSVELKLENGNLPWTFDYSIVDVKAVPAVQTKTSVPVVDIPPPAPLRGVAGSQVEKTN